MFLISNENITLKVCAKAIDAASFFFPSKEKDIAESAVLHVPIGQGAFAQKRKIDQVKTI